MKAHYCRSKFRKYVGHLMAERRPAGSRRNAQGIDAEFFIRTRSQHRNVRMMIRPDFAIR
jgi:hypothetical protein